MKINLQRTTIYIYKKPTREGGGASSEYATEILNSIYAARLC